MEKEAQCKKRKMQASSTENPLVFKRRKEGIKKKAAELSILCDIPVCLLIQAPNGEFEIWPENPDQTRIILHKYKQACNDSQAKILSQNPTEISTGKPIPETREEVFNQAKTVLGKYNEKPNEPQTKILTQNPGEQRMNLEKCKKKCHEYEAGMFNQNSSVSLCPEDNGTKTREDNDLINGLFGEKGFSEIPGESRCSGNLGRIANGSSFLQEGKESVETGCDQRNALINDPCLFSEVYDLPPQEILDPDSGTAGACFSYWRHVDDFSLPNLRLLDSSVMGDSNWQSFPIEESSLWSSILEEVGVPSLIPGGLLPECPESIKLGEWDEFYC